MSRYIFKYFLYISFKAACFCFLGLKIEDNRKKLTTISGSSPNYDISNHSQSQTGVTVPLIGIHQN
jgi:hypothetical protein